MFTKANGSGDFLSEAFPSGRKFSLGFEVEMVPPSPETLIF